MSSNVTFPCEYLIKVIGKADASFTNDICEIVSSQTTILNLGENQSANKRYTSLSITINATDEALIKTLFERLTKHPAVKMVL